MEGRFHNPVRHKNLSLTASFAASYGGKAYSLTNSILSHMGFDQFARRPLRRADPSGRQCRRGRNLLEEHDHHHRCGRLLQYGDLPARQYRIERFRHLLPQDEGVRASSIPCRGASAPRRRYSRAPRSRSSPRTSSASPTSHSTTPKWHRSPVRRSIGVWRRVPIPWCAPTVSALSSDSKQDKR